MAFIDDKDQYEDLVNALKSSIDEAGVKTEFTEEEKKNVRKSRDRGLSENIAQGMLDVFDKLVVSSGELTELVADKIGVDTVESELEELSKDRLEKSKERKQLLRESQIGGYPVSIAESLVEPALEATAMWRLGIVGAETGAGAIPMTSASWAGSEYAIRKALGDTDEQALESATMAGALGKAFGTLPVVSKAASNALQSEEEILKKNFEEGGSMAGGGRPPEQEFQYFDKEFVDDVTKDEAFPETRNLYEETKDIRDIEEMEGVGMRMRLTEEDAPLEVKSMYSDYKKLEEGVEQRAGINLIYKHNKDLFRDMKPEEVSAELTRNNKLYQGLLKDTTEELRLKLDIDRGIKVGESETLFDETFPNSAKAEELATVKAGEKESRLQKAKEVQELQSKRNVMDFTSLRKELDEANIEYNKIADEVEEGFSSPRDLEFAEIRLNRAMQTARNYHGDKKTIDGTIDDLYEVDNVQPSKWDRGFEPRNLRSKETFSGEIKPSKKNDMVNILRKQLDKQGVDRPKLEAKIAEKEAEMFDDVWTGSKATEIKASELVGTEVYNKHKNVFDMFLKNNEASIKIVDEPIDVLPDGNVAVGKYDGVNNRVLIMGRRSPDETMDTIAHEIVHGVTFKHLADKSSPLYYKAEEVFNRAKELHKGKEDYWKTDVEEFFSEVYSNKALQKELRKNPTLWENIKWFIADTIAGRPLRLKEFNKVNKDIDNLMKEMSETTVSKEVKQQAPRSSIKQDIKENTSKMTNFMSDVLDTPSAENFRKLHNATKQAFDSASRYKEETINMLRDATKDMPNNGKQFRESLYKHVLRVDYNSIKEFKKPSEANKYWKENLEVYRKASKEIEALAKSMKDSKYMNDVNWRPNGLAIAKKLGMDESLSSIIEKLVSIRAMDASDWKFVMDSQDNKAFKLTLDMMTKRDQLSNEVFKDNPYNKTKGYISEVYSNLPDEFTYKKGAIPVTTQQKIKGEEVNVPKELEGKSIEEVSMLEKVGVVLNKDGIPYKLRKVASEDSKVNRFGKEYDAGEVLGETLASSVRKTNINTFFQKKFDEVISDEKNGLFNGKGDEFTGLSKAEREMIGSQFSDKIRTIHKDYKHQLLGNKEVHIRTANQAGITAQLFVKDLVRNFKTSVVLKNPVSYVNNFVFSYTMGLQNGISPARMFKYQKEGLEQYKTMRRLQEEIIQESIKHTDKTPRYNQLVKEIQELDMYKMYKEGLAFSVLSDIVHSDASSKGFIDKKLKKVMVDLFGQETADKVGNIASEIYLSTDAKTGRFLIDTFTKIDVMGRYGIAKDAIEKGSSIKDAVNKSNSIFGDLDKLSPVWVQAISEFGFIPFGNWYYRVAGGIGKNSVENYGKAIGLAAALYVAQDVSGKRTESFNPLLSMAAAPMDMLSMSPYFNIDKIPETIAIPQVYQKAADGDVTKMVVSDAF